MFLLKYLGSLAVAVFFATYAIFFMPFVWQAVVATGEAHQAHLSFELAVQDGAANYSAVDAAQAQFLSKHISLLAQGSARILSANVQVTPAAVSVSSRQGYSQVPGAAMTADLIWDTPPNTVNGAEGRVLLNFPQLPGLEGARALLSSGPHTVDRSGHYVILEEAAYCGHLWLCVERLFLALSLALPAGMLVHTVAWYFLGVRAERRTRIAQLPEQGPVGILPRSFFPDPVAEWRIGLAVLAVFALAATLFAYRSVGVVNYAFTDFAYILVAAGIPIAAAVADYTGATVLNLRVEWRGLSIARGRGRLHWHIIPWDQITEIRKSYRRVEMSFKGQRRKLRISGRVIMDYASLYSSVKQCWRRPEETGCTP